MEIKKEKGLIIALDRMEPAVFFGYLGWLQTLKGNFAIKIGRPLEMVFAKNGLNHPLLHARDKLKDKLPIIYDGKIADIPFISAQIAEDAYEMGADAVIMHGFMGEDVVQEVISLGKPVILVVAMSNSGSTEYLDQVSKSLAWMCNGLEIEGIVLPATRPVVIEKIKELILPSTFIISPGIKAQGAQPGDAIRAGADYEVVGRAITGANDPKAAAEALYQQILES